MPAYPPAKDARQERRPVRGARLAQTTAARADEGSRPERSPMVVQPPQWFDDVRLAVGPIENLSFVRHVAN